MKTWISVCLAVSALSVQTMLLHPWHDRLSIEIKELQDMIKNLEKKNQNLAIPEKKN